MKKIKILGNLEPELDRLGFDRRLCKEFSKRYSCVTTEYHNTWVDEETKQEYVTIDLGVEIPIQCVEFLD